MSHVIKTALVATFRDLAIYHENRIADIDAWVSTQSGWDDEKQNVYFKDNVSADVAGKDEAVNTLTRFRDGLKVEKAAEVIINTILEKAKGLPGFKERLEEFVTDLEAGKIPSGGRAVGASV